MAFLRILSPNGGSRVALVPHSTLGRLEASTVCINDGNVSKEHCHIDLIEGRYVLKDLGSLNGTYVNGIRVTDKTLVAGDEISIGGTKLVFEPDAEAHNPRVTIAGDLLDSYIRTKLAAAAAPRFLPEKSMSDIGLLRQDYEKLRVSFEVSRAIGSELDIDKLLGKILDCAFEILAADRGVVLLFDANKELVPRCARTRAGEESSEHIVLSSTIINEVLKNKVAILSSDATMDSRFSGAKSIIMQGIRSSMAVPLLYSQDLLGIMLLDSQIAVNAFANKDLELFQALANQAAVAIQNSLFAQEIEQQVVARQRIKRLLSPAIAEQVLRGDVEIKKGGELRTTTILFADIRGFTTMSERTSPQEVVDMLNEYFERMVEIIFRNEGTLDKFVGDAIMALFGAPVAHNDDPGRAVRTAIQMVNQLRELNEERRGQNLEPLHIGIGINTGEVVAGYLGSSQALEYTVVGDVVNTCSRLCSIAAPGEILVSGQTRDALDDTIFRLEARPDAQLRGKSQALSVYRVLGMGRTTLTDHKRPG